MEERLESVMDNLEPGIVMDILSRLPIHSLFQCRRVCRNWRRTIGSREFILTHFTRSFRTHNCKRKMIDESDLSLIACVGENSLDVTNLYFVQLGMPRETSIINCHFDTLCPNDCFYSDDDEGQFQVVGSCNGLLCIGDATIINPLYVCNPITQEFMRLPDNTLQSEPALPICSGFVFDAATGEYKVVSIFPVSTSQQQWCVEYEYRTYMLTLGITSWEYVGKAPAAPYKMYPNSCVLVNGALHWRTIRRNKSGVYIMAFDIASKEFAVVPPPPDRQVLDGCRWKLCNLEGHLAVVTYHKANVAAVWEMSEYKVESSWNKTDVPDWKIDPSNLGLLLESSYPSSQYGNFKVPWEPYDTDVFKHVGSLISPWDAIKLYKKDKKNEAGRDRKHCGTEPFHHLKEKRQKIGWLITKDDNV